MHPLLVQSRFAARLVNGYWCYCEMGYDANGVYGVKQVLSDMTFPSREDVYEAARLGAVGNHI